MTLTELTRLFRSFASSIERALTRVENQGVRVEQALDNIIDHTRRAADGMSELRAELRIRSAGQDDEIAALKKQLAAVQKQLGGQNAPRH